MYPIESHCSGSNIALLLLYLYPSSSQLLFVNLLSYLCVYSVLMNKHFSSRLPLVSITRGFDHSYSPETWRHEFWKIRWGTGTPEKPPIAAIIMTKKKKRQTNENYVKSRKIFSISNADAVGTPSRMESWSHCLKHGTTIGQVRKITWNPTNPKAQTRTRTSLKWSNPMKPESEICPRAEKLRQIKPMKKEKRKIPSNRRWSPVNVTESWSYCLKHGTTIEKFRQTKPKKNSSNQRRWSPVNVTESWSFAWNIGTTIGRSQVSLGGDQIAKEKRKNSVKSTPLEPRQSNGVMVPLPETLERRSAKKEPPKEVYKPETDPYQPEYERKDAYKLAARIVHAERLCHVFKKEKISWNWFTSVHTTQPISSPRDRSSSLPRIPTDPSVRETSSLSPKYFVKSTNAEKITWNWFTSILTTQPISSPKDRPPSLSQFFSSNRRTHNSEGHSTDVRTNPLYLDHHY